LHSVCCQHQVKVTGRLHPFEAACSSTTYGQLHSWSFPLACPCSVRRRVGPHSPRVMLQVQVNGRGPTRRLLKTRLVWASKGMHPGSYIPQSHKSCAWHPCRARLLELSKTTCHAAMHRVHSPSSAKTGATLERYTCPRAALDCWYARPSAPTVERREE
jgi:hypothetical protein